MREELDADAARKLEEEIREVMRRYGVSAIYIADSESRGGVRYWSFGDGRALLMMPARQPQTYAVARVAVAQAA